MRYKGAVNYYTNLPLNPTQGDVWVVRYEGTTGVTPNGHAYCWDEAPVSDEPDAVLELQWIDLGNLGEFLPSNTGKIYYNGVCYSGGGATGNFFSKTEIDTGKNNLRSLYNSTLNTAPDADFINNLIFLDGGNVSISGNNLDIYGNFINTRGGNLSFTSSLYSNFIFGESHVINVKSLTDALIFGRSNEIRDYGSQLNSGLHSPILIGDYNIISGSSDFNFSSSNTAYALIGSYNQIGIVSGDWLGCYGLYAFGNRNELSGYENYIIGYGNKNSGSKYSTNMGIENLIGGSSYSYSIGYYNKIQGSRNISCIGLYNDITSSEDSFIFGYRNTFSNSRDVYIFGEIGGISSSLTESIRLGFYPLDNDDFFSIGDGNGNYSRSSIIRIDSSKNIYLNSTIPTPPIPATNGTYSLNVLNGASSWVERGGGSDVPELPTTPGVYMLLVENTSDPDTRTTESGDDRITENNDDRAEEILTNTYTYSWSALPTLPTSDGDYKLHITNGVATWVAIS